MNNLLVVDFDFFFPNPVEAGNLDDPTAHLYDWGHAEAPIFLMLPVWIHRATGFLNNDLPLPGALTLDGGWATFWNRFTFAENAQCSYADSNAHAGLLRPVDGSPAFDQVVLFDAHHDSGYNIPTFDAYRTRPSFTCEDWLLEHQSAGTRDLTVRYPQWKSRGVEESLPVGVLTKQVVDDGEPVGVIFDDVFICRSGAWVPPWCDRDFLDFVEACPVPANQLDEVELDRGFSLDDATRIADQMRQNLSALPHAASAT